MIDNENWCLIPCLFCGGGLRNAHEGNQPLGGTEFIGGGCYGSALTDHGRFYYVVNICDSCLKDAIESGHVLKQHTVRPPAPTHTYELLTSVGDKGHRAVTEEELLTALGEKVETRATMEDACKTLKADLFRWKTEGYLGMGDGKIIVFVRGSAASWAGHTCTEWQGWPLEWHYDCVEPTTKGPD